MFIVETGSLAYGCVVNSSDSSNRFPKMCSPSSEISCESAENEDQLMETLPYYHHHLHRSDIEFILRRSGDYLLRKGTQSGQPVVSVLWQGVILHFPIRKMPSGCRFESMTCVSVNELIDWHRNAKVPLTRETGAILKYPKPLAAWELLTNHLIQGRKLHAGRFGDIYAGKVIIRNKTKRAAVIKTMSSVNWSEAGKEAFEMARDTLLREAQILRDLAKHPNIVKCFGVTINGVDGRFSIALELMRDGRLDDRLKMEPMLTPKKKLELCMKAAKALLQVHCHGYVHRNICARNFLVILDGQKDVCALKMSGFDFARRVDAIGIYKASEAERLPNTPQTAAIESLTSSTWTQKSDVWSWAVLVWEIYTNAGKPYHTGYGYENCASTECILPILRKGLRLRPHSDMNQQLLDVWNQCFIVEQERRPTAYKIVREFEVMMPK